MRLRAGEASRSEMAFAADRMEGKVKPRRRRSNQPSRIENELIAQFVFYLQAIRPAWQKRKVVGKIADMIGVEWRHVYNVLQKARSRTSQILRTDRTRCRDAYKASPRARRKANA
jgi:hypothetical protein